MKRLPSVFEFQGYKTFLREVVRHRDSERGFQASLAAAAQCQRSYFSLVLNGSAHLSSEQAMRLSRYLNLNEEENDHFFLLLSLERATTVELKEYFQNRLKKAQAQRKQITTRLETSARAQNEELFLFYSHWIYSAIYMLLQDQGGRTVKDISTQLDVPQATAGQAIQKLESLGLAEKSQGGYRVRPVDLHLPAGSAHLPSHHRNWRERAVHDSLLGNPESVHYSALYTMTKKDSERLHVQIVNWIEKTRKIAVASNGNEEMVCLNVDYFKVSPV